MKYKRILAAGLLVTMMGPAANIAMANEETFISSTVEDSANYVEISESDSSNTDETPVLEDSTSDSQTDSETSPDEAVPDSDGNLPSEETTSEPDSSLPVEDSDTSDDSNDILNDVAQTEEDAEIESENTSDTPKEDLLKDQDTNDSEPVFSDSAKEALETPVQYEVGEVVTLPDGKNFYREGYIFVGWNTDPDATEGFFEILMEENTTLYAIWIPEADSTPSESLAEKPSTEDQTENKASAIQTEPLVALQPTDALKSNEDDFIEESMDA